MDVFEYLFWDKGDWLHNCCSGSENNITPPARRLQVTRTDDAAMEEMKTMVNQMSSNEWRQRHDAITSLQEMCIDNPNLIATHIVKVILTVIVWWECWHHRGSNTTLLISVFKVSENGREVFILFFREEMEERMLKVFSWNSKLKSSGKMLND